MADAMGDVDGAEDPSTSEPLVQVRGVDHVVLKVRDPEVSVRWYSGLLGLAPERLEEWRRGEVLFVSVRVDGSTIIDLFQGEPDGVNVDHVAFVVDDVDLQAVADSGAFEVVGGPAELWGAQGQGSGLYVKDPDGHTVELRTYPSASA
jgi:catechol 2,3-dioxygenase-like lactoylglutathione lyase family enzyme